jgi:hypothetical protein
MSLKVIETYSKANRVRDCMMTLTHKYIYLLIPIP